MYYYNTFKIRVISVNIKNLEQGAVMKHIITGLTFICFLSGCAIYGESQYQAATQGKNGQNSNAMVVTVPPPAPNTSAAQVGQRATTRAATMIAPITH